MTLTIKTTLVLLWAGAALIAQNNVTTPSSCTPIQLTGGAYAESFDSLANTNSAASPAGSTLLPQGWQINEQGSGAAANGQYRSGTGSDTGGDVYSFGPASATDRALGQLRSGSSAAIIGACFQNGSSNTITALAISYRGEIWRAGAANRVNPQDQMDFQYKIGATSVTDTGWTDVNTLDLVSLPFTTVGAKDGNANFTSPSGTISGLNIAPGGTFYIRWTDQDPSSSDDGLGIDEFSLIPSFSSGGTISITSSVSSSEAGGAIAFTVSINSPAPLGGVGFTASTANGTATAGSRLHGDHRSNVHDSGRLDEHHRECPGCQ